jgi:hypothetical protein
MKPLIRLIVAFLVLLALAPATSGQSPTTPRPPLVRADLAASAGLFTADRETANDCCSSSSWSAGLFRGAGGGFYWTDHLKTEAEVALPGQTQAYSYFSERISGNQFRYTQERHSYSDRRLSLAQVYQFGRNATFHPFVLGGVDIDRERETVERYVSTSSGPTNETETSATTTRARPFAGVGFKAYMSERAFFRGEVRLAGKNGRADQLVWKAGFGIDFPSRRSAAVRAPEPVDRWRTYAGRLPAGSLVSVAVAGGEQFQADFLSADEAGIVVHPRTRTAEPVRHIPFDRLEQLTLSGGSTGAAKFGAVAMGTGVGSGVFWTLLFITLSQLSD